MGDDNTVLDLLRKTDRGRLLFETAKQIRDLGPELTSEVSNILYVVGAVTKYEEVVKRCVKDIATRQPPPDISCARFLPLIGSDTS